jgi:phospholipase C
MKRREAIKTLGALAGAASMSKLLTACGSDGAGPGIDTFVFLLMENRSYDHYLGARSLVEGLGGDGLTAGMFNPDSGGNPIAIWPATEPSMCAVDPPHGWNASRTQLNGGANDGFIIAHQERAPGAIDPMQYMLREHVPVANALADAYTSCDRWFCSVLGPTLPNRMYWHAGTSNGATNNDDVLGGAYEGVDTLYHRLDTAGVDWAYYYGDVPVLAVLEGNQTEGKLRRFLYDFIDDAAAGKLPPVVYIDPAFGSNDDHPPHHPLLGQQLISAVYTALATSPHWERCMLVVSYDENGGFFDHVAPPTTADDKAAEGFDQLGFRVPSLVAGPYAKQGYVSSVQYDHTSCLKHLENVYGLAPLTARSTAATDLSDCIDLERLADGEPAAPIQLPAVEIDESELPSSCLGGGLSGPYEHDILAWADANQKLLGDLDLRGETRDYTYGIAEYLDEHNLGRIKR